MNLSEAVIILKESGYDLFNKNYPIIICADMGTGKNYDKKLDEMARGCLRAEKDPEFIAMCEEHDRMMEEELRKSI